MSTPLIPPDTAMKPVLLLPPDTVSDADVQGLKDNGFCVVVAKDPGAVKFLDPIPSVAGRTSIEDAAIALSRKVLDQRTYNGSYTSLSRKDLTAMFLDILVKGTSLDPLPSVAEVERQAYDRAHLDEVQKIAREDAREAAKAKKESRNKAK